ncbi:MAG: hypothetical protein V5A62_08045 [Haloarculaceae archaeon]
MRDAEGEDPPISERRGLLRRVRGHPEVVAVEFTRDGFRTVFAEVYPRDDLDESLRCEAERLGYAVRRPGTDEHRRWRLTEWWEGDHENVYVFRLDSDRAPFSP